MRRLKDIFKILIFTGMLVRIMPVCAYTVGDTVADFTLPDADGRLVSLSDYRGSVVLINFWTSG